MRMKKSEKRFSFFGRKGLFLYRCSYRYMCRMAIFWDIKLKFCMWYRSAPIYSLYEFKSNRREKNHDFFTSSDCAEIWNIWLSNRVHEKTNFKKLFFQKLRLRATFFLIFGPIELNFFLFGIYAKMYPNMKFERILISKKWAKKFQFWLKMEKNVSYFA